MGLSSKQVSSDMNDWNQALLEGGARTLEFPLTSPMKRQPQQQQQIEPLKCPRCDSTNTKFCYYNNYNKSQPRHFCKACKRHWTKGGTLRNVPVGGGRKNKRLKMSKTASKTNTTTTNNIDATLMSGISNINNPLQAVATLSEAGYCTTLALGALNSKIIIEDKSNFSEGLLYQNFLKQQPGSLPQTSSITFTNRELSNDEIQFPCSNLGSFESNPCSISSTITSIQSPNLYNFTNDHENNNGGLLEETIIPKDNSSMSDHHDDHESWRMYTTSSNWGWDDFDKFVSIEANDLTMPWDDANIKP